MPNSCLGADAVEGGTTMRCRTMRGLALVLAAAVSVLFHGRAIAQENNTELIHRPARIEVLQDYLKKLGYTKARQFKEKNIEGLAFVIKDRKTDEFLKLSALLNPNDRLLKFECHDLANVPPNPDRLLVLLQKLVELNGTRTIGKYYVNFDSGKVQYFYFQSVLGGICFADFERTIKLIEIIVLNDLEAIREIVTS